MHLAIFLPDNEEAAAVREALTRAVPNTRVFDPGSATEPGEYHQALAEVLETSGLKKGQVFMPLRAALTGRKSGPEIPLIVEVLGRQRTLDLLDAATESEADR